jgi:alpha-L-fucosidase
MYTWSTSVRSSSPLKSITLPGLDRNRLHIFALTVTPAGTNPPRDGPWLSFRHSRLTTKYRMIKGRKAYAFESTISNILPLAVAPDPTYWVDGQWFTFYNSPVLDTLEVAWFYRIMPGDEIVVKIWVAPNNRSTASIHELIQAERLNPGTLTIGNSASDVIIQSKASFAPTEEGDALVRDVPQWWEHSRFGIFMHWGIYAVPGWAPPGVYA